MFHKQLLRHLEGYRTQTLVTPLLVIADTAAELFIVSLMADIIDIGIPRQDTAFVLRTGGQMLLLCLISAVCGTLGVYFAAQASQGYGANLRSAVFRRIMALPAEALDRFSSGSLITRITNDISNIQTAFVISIRMMIRIPIMVLVSLVMTCRIHLRLSLLLLAALPPLFFLLRQLIVSCSARFLAVQEKLDRLCGVVQEDLIAVRVIRAFGRMGQEQRRFSAASGDLADASLRAVRRSLLLRPAAAVSLSFVTAAVLLRGSGYAAAGELTLGELYSFLTFLTIIITNLSSIAGMLTRIVRAEASAGRVRELLALEEEVSPPPCPAAPDGSGLSVEGVCFRYGEGAPVLSQLSFSLSGGQHAALVGATGSGKSTVAALLSALYAPQSGRILLDGRALSALSFSQRRREIAVVPQDCMLFSGTLRDDLRWGCPAASDEQLWEALRAAQAEEFVRALPGGLDTAVAQDGSSFSGGQRQRLCIARALVAHPRLLILDDATSALDQRTEATLFAALRRFCPHTIVLAVTHRIRAIPEDWQILLLEGGAIRESGTRRELLALDGAYSALVQATRKGGDA